jgi:VanZ family protein
LWLVWAVYGVVWTTFLLTTFPLKIRDAVVPEEYAFPSGKALHVAAYAVFAVLTAWLPVRQRWRWLLLGLLSLHAFGTEFTQQFVGRGASLTDVGLDHIGLLAGVLLTWKCWRTEGQASRERQRPESAADSGR